MTTVQAAHAGPDETRYGRAGVAAVRARKLLLLLLATIPYALAFLVGALARGGGWLVGFVWAAAAEGWEHAWSDREAVDQ